jgi:tagatose-6-phosphate ketose/aldose isomerase
MSLFFGLSAADIARQGGEHTAREIEQQPGVWRDLETQALGATEIRDFLAPLLKRTDLRIVLTGAGTSAFIGQCLAPALVARTAGFVSAVPTTDIVAGPARWLKSDAPLLLVSFARSGNSPESVAAVDLAERTVRECHQLIITCNPSGALYQRALGRTNARALLLPTRTDDRGFAMTSSFSGMLLAAALLLGLKAQHGIESLARAGQEMLARCAPLVSDLVAQRFERVVYLGANELQGLAQEAALKMLELSDGRVVAIANSPLGFRHGPKTILDGKTLVVVFLSNDSYTRRYDRDLLSELRADGIAGRILALAAEGEAARADELHLPTLRGCGDWELCLPFAVFAQSFALQQSLALGVRPDNPNAAGAVSRVVKGVSIYPLVRAG